MAYMHLETGIRSFTEITPRHPPILDKEAAVQDYVAQNLRMLDGEKTRMCDILAHFRATAKIAEKLLTDREFSGLLLNAINNTLDWQDKIDYRNATVILGMGAPKLLQKKACQTSSGKRVTDFC